MMPEISLNILDIAQNSIKANATEVFISIDENTSQNRLSVIIKDNGCGMSDEQLTKVTDPFFTSRTTRKVGLGVPFFKLSAELTGGSFDISSQVGIGTTTIANFVLDSIDRMPLGDIDETLITLITLNQHIDFVFKRSYNDKNFVMKTSDFKDILGDIPLSSPEVVAFIREYLKENSNSLYE